MEAEKRKIDTLEQILEKERRDKRAALTCLHTAEAKLTQLNWELDNLKKRYEPLLEPTTFELTFDSGER